MQPSPAGPWLGLLTEPHRAAADSDPQATWGENRGATSHQRVSHSR
jgi:hypothetical protein